MGKQRNIMRTGNFAANPLGDAQPLAAKFLQFCKI